MKMPQVDMSAQAVTARLKLVSDLRDLCLLLGKAKIDEETPHRQRRKVRKKTARQTKSK
jgi:hypothetical protein